MLQLLQFLRSYSLVLIGLVFSLFQLRLYAEQLELIFKGDVVKASMLESEPLNKFFDGPGGQNDDNFSNETTDSKKSRQDLWTSLQFSKANVVLSQFMREKSKRCKNCEKRNPKITSPTFGWLKMVC